MLSIISLLFGVIILSAVLVVLSAHPVFLLPQGSGLFFYCVKKLAIDPGVDFVHCGLSFGRRWGAGVTAHEVIIRALGVLLDVLRE